MSPGPRADVGFLFTSSMDKYALLQITICHLTPSCHSRANRNPFFRLCLKPYMDSHFRGSDGAACGVVQDCLAWSLSAVAKAIAHNYSCLKLAGLYYLAIRQNAFIRKQVRNLLALFNQVALVAVYHHFRCARSGVVVARHTHAICTCRHDG